MPTQEMPDNELDDLFRKAAGEYNAEFEPEAWKRMEQLLDERDGRTGGYWWKGILVMLALLLVGTLGVVLVRNPENAPGSSATGQRQPAASTAPAAAAAPADGNAVSARDVTAQRDATGEATRPGQTGNDGSTTNGTAPGSLAENQSLGDGKTITGSKIATENTAQKDAENAPEKATPGSDDENASMHRMTAGVEKRKNAPGGETGLASKRTPALVTTGPGGIRPETPGTAPRKRQRIASAEKQPLSPGRRPGGKPPGTTTNGAGEARPAEAVARNGADRTGGTAPPLSESGNTSQPAGERLPELAFLTGKSLTATASELGRPNVPPPAVREAEATPIQPVAKQQRPTGRLSVGVMVSPDLSSIGLSGRLTPGTNAGVQLEYRLTNRFRVGVGAIHSVKLYSAKVEDYTVPYGFWTYGVKPSDIEANCKILDLPVHLRFDALRRTRYAAFVSTGLSSYIMLSERYGYHYPTYDPYLRPEWRGKRTGAHYLSVVHLSVGYERNLGRRFSWQAEPFLKLPLGGVGFGKVRLSSSGVFVALKYKIGKTDQ